MAHVTPARHVCGFVWAVLKRIVPPPLLGGPGNAAALKRHVCRFVSLRRFEQMSLHNATQGVATGDFARLALGPEDAGDGRAGGRHAAKGHVARQEQLGLWVWWLFGAVVTPVLRSFFYCTETQAHRFAVVYFRKPVWRALERAALAQLTESTFQPIPATQALATLATRQLGPARLRLLPKLSGMRPLVNMGCRTRVSISKAQLRRLRAALPPGRGPPAPLLSFRPINALLLETHLAMKLDAAAAAPAALDSSVSSYNAVYAQYKRFVASWRARRGGAPPPLFLAFDISRAYDSLDLEVVMQLVRAHLMRQETYTLGRLYATITARGRIVNRFVNYAMPPGSGAVLEALRGQGRAACGPQVLCDIGGKRLAARRELLQLLEAHLRDNLLLVGARWCKQVRGIPQGSIASSLLCGLYLTHLQQTLLDPLLLRPSHAPPPPPAASHSAHGHLTSLARAAASCTQPSSSSGAARSAPPIGDVAPTPAAAAAASAAARSVPRRPSPPPREPESAADDGAARARRTGDAAAAARVAADGAAGGDVETVLMHMVDDFLLVTEHACTAAAVAAAATQRLPACGLRVNVAKLCSSAAVDLPNGSRLEAAADGGTLPWCGLRFNVADLSVTADYARLAQSHVSSSLVIPHASHPARALQAKLCGFLHNKLHPLLLDTDLNGRAGAALNLFQAFAFAAMRAHCYLAALPAGARPALVCGALEHALLYAARTSARVMEDCARLTGVEGAFSLCSLDVEALGLKAFQATFQRKRARYLDVLAYIAARLSQPKLARRARMWRRVMQPRLSAHLWALRF